MKLEEQDFISWLQARELKEESIKDYLYYFRKFKYDTIDQENISDFLARRFNNNVARAFVKNLKAFIIENRSAMNLSVQETSEISLISLPKITGRTKVRVMNILSEEQIELLQQAMPVERNKVMLLLSYFGGLRIGELLKIKGKDFSWTKWTKDKKKMGELKVLGKGDKERLVLVPPGLMMKVAKWINSSAVDQFHRNLNLFPSRTRWREILSKASRIALDRKINPHLLRHSFATNMLKKGFQIEEVQSLLGHADIKSTTVYLHLNKEDLKEKFISILQS